jgi:hypothetical protein
MTISPSSTMSMSAPTHGNSYRSERMWQTNGASEVHAESADVVGPVVSESEGARGTGGFARYYAGGR